MPSLFLQAPPLNITRLLELTSFALPQLVGRGRARAGLDALDGPAVRDLMSSGRGGGGGGGGVGMVGNGSEATPGRRELLRPLAGR